MKMLGQEEGSDDEVVMVGGKIVTMSGNVAEHLKNFHISPRDPNDQSSERDWEAVEVLVQMRNQNRKSVITETRAAAKGLSSSSSMDNVPPFPDFPQITNQLKELSASKTSIATDHEELRNNGRAPSYDKSRTVENDSVPNLGAVAKFERIMGIMHPSVLPSTTTSTDNDGGRLKEPEMRRPRQRGIGSLEPQILEHSSSTTKKEKRRGIRDIQPEIYPSVEIRDKDKFSKNFSPWVKDKSTPVSAPLPYLPPLPPSPQFSGGGLVKIISPPSHSHSNFPTFFTSPFFQLTPPPTPNLLTNYNLNLNLLPPQIIPNPKSSPRECLSPLNLNVNSPLSKSLNKFDLLKKRKEEKRFFRSKISLSLDSTKPIEVDGFTIPREHWAKAFVQTDFCHAAGILFKSLFTPEEIQSCTLRGRNGTSQLSHQKRAAIFRAVGWMRVKNQDPYSFSASNLLSSCYQLNEDERALIEKKVFVERRYQTSRKIREIPYKPPSVRRKLAEQALLAAQAQAQAQAFELKLSSIKPEPPDEDYDSYEHEMPLQIQFDTPPTIYIKEERDLDSPSPPKQAKLSKENFNSCSV